jgi:hypothetical protein
LDDAELLLCCDWGGNGFKKQKTSTTHTSFVFGGGRVSVMTFVCCSDFPAYNSLPHSKVLRRCPRIYVWVQRIVRLKKEEEDIWVQRIVRLKKEEEDVVLLLVVSSTTTTTTTTTRAWRLSNMPRSTESQNYKQGLLLLLLLLHGHGQSLRKAETRQDKTRQDKTRQDSRAGPCSHRLEGKDVLCNLLGMLISNSAAELETGGGFL